AGEKVNIAALNSVPASLRFALTLVEYRQFRCRRSGWPTDAEVPIRFQGQDPPPWSPGNEPLLQQIGLNDVFQRIARLRQCRGERLNADRAAFVVRENTTEIAMIQRIEPLGVDLEHLQRPVGDHGIDD